MQNTLQGREWRELEMSPNYEVSNFGEVANIRTDTLRKLSINQQGIVRVTLYDPDSRLITRSVAKMVAETFVPRPDNPQFDTPIHLDGDYTNCRADNLVWRPRWFAIKFHKQFWHPAFRGLPRRNLMDSDTEDIYPGGIKEICTTHGLYWLDVAKSLDEGDYRVFPTFQQFEYVPTVEESDPSDFM